MELASFRMDQSRLSGGVKLFFDDKTFIVVRSMRSAEAKEAVNRLSAPVRKKLDRGTISDEEGGKLLTGLAEALMVSWEGWTEDGKPVTEKAKLSGLEIIRESVIAFAKDDSNFTDAAREEGLEELGKLSDGSSPTADE